MVVFTAQVMANDTIIISSTNCTVAGDTKFHGEKRKQRIQQTQNSKGIHPNCETRAVDSKN